MTKQLKINQVPKPFLQLIDLHVAKVNKQDEAQGTLTREAYIREYLENLAQVPAVTQKELEAEVVIRRLLDFIDRNNHEWLELLSLLDEDWEQTLKDKWSKREATEE
ncbi:hypothetical protein [Listeria goaensis]|uniref:hypothetical protein n=1 Tax=Listeria goaensis TaxID=1649188 RepID=UPI000B590B2B|nr:hypothetical protein [Listeria goaensis]